jgi:hypothetical protein
MTSMAAGALRAPAAAAEVAKLNVSMPTLTADDWNNIAWNLPAGQALRAKIEALVTALKPEQALLLEKVAERDTVRKAHAKSVAIVAEAEALLARLQSRRSEMDGVLGEVRQQLEEIKKALLKLTKADLDQLRRMPDPPVPIRRTLEMVHLILNCPTVNVGQKVDFEAHIITSPRFSNLHSKYSRALTFQNLCQRQCRRTLARSDLIPTILNFDVDSLVQHQHVAAAVEQNYLGGRNFCKVSALS